MNECGHNMLKDREVVTVRFNWMWLVVAAYIWVYGLFVGLAHHELSRPAHLLVSVVLTLLLAFLVAIAVQGRDQYADQICIRRTDVLVMTGFALMSGGVAWSDLNVRDLNGDPAHYSLMSIVHATRIVARLPLFGEYEHQTSVRILNLCLLIAVTMLVWLGIRCRRNRWGYMASIGTVVVGFFCIRVVLDAMGMVATTHPPLFYWPLWVSFTTLGFSGFAGRLPQLLVLVLTMWLIWRILTPKLTFWPALCVAAVSGTMPVVLHSGTIVAPSIYMWSFTTLFLVSVATHDSSWTPKWERWTALLSLAILARISTVVAFVLLISVFVCCTIEGRVKLRNSFSSLLWPVWPLLAALPFVVQSLAFGTGATQANGVTAGWPVFYEHLTSGDCFLWIHRSLGTIGCVFLIIGLVPFGRMNLHYSVAVSAFLVAAVVMFDSTLTAGAGRYQSEYAAPIAVLGMTRLCMLATTARRLPLRLLIITTGTVLFAVNVADFRRLFDLPRQPGGIVSIIPRYPFYKGWELARDLGVEQSALRVSQSRLYNPFLPSVMGKSVREVLAHDRFSRREELIRQGTLTPQALDADLECRCVLVASNYSSFGDELAEMGWITQATIGGPEVGARVAVLIRP